jgi:hypothetical protein
METNGIMEARERTSNHLFELDLRATTGLLPDTPVESAGIYKCENCGYEAVVRKFECLPREKSCSEHGMAEPSDNSSEVSWCLAIPVLGGSRLSFKNRHRRQSQD